MRYEIKTKKHCETVSKFRVVDTISDNTIATCFVEENAELVCASLNFKHEIDTTTPIKCDCGNDLETADEKEAQECDECIKFNSLQRSLT